jgi:hypothetical protein
MQNALLTIQGKNLYYMNIEPLRDYISHILGTSLCSHFMSKANKTAERTDFGTNGSLATRINGGEL